MPEMLLYSSQIETDSLANMLYCIFNEFVLNNHLPHIKEKKQ